MGEWSQVRATIGINCFNIFLARKQAKLYHCATYFSLCANGYVTKNSYDVCSTCRRRFLFMKNVLLVEDDADDLFFMKKACEGADFPHALQVVTDGQAAIDYLSGVGIYEDRLQHPLPELVFLDIKLPLRSGHEVLEWLRGQPAFKTLPVVMLTSSNHPSDIERAYRLGVTSYLLKNADPVEFCQGVRIILKYWLRLNMPPNGSQ
jgi:CheY-like chemotaxis protein